MKFRNGLLFDRDRSLTCGDGIMVLGREEDYRRHMNNLKDYLDNPPKFKFGLVNNYY